MKATLDGKFNDAGEIVAGADAKQSAGAFKATADGLIGTIRGRILAKPPFAQDFESFELTEEHPADANTPAPTSSPIRRCPGLARASSSTSGTSTGTRCSRRTSTAFSSSARWSSSAPEDMRDYTVQADVMTDGNRRAKSDVGVINQRYIIVLKGNANELEVSSNFERFKRAVPFPVKGGQWYALKTQVQVNPDGTGAVLAKAWEKDQPEPAEWTIKAETPIVHQQGSPGLFGFTPQNQMRVYIDNVKVTPNK